MDNKNNNPIVQALLDLKVFSDNPSLIDALLKETSALQKAAEKFDKHQYPDKSIKYGRLTTYRESPAFVNLARKSQSAATLFTVLCGICISPTNDIAIPLNEMQEFTGMAKNTLKAARDLLLDNGFIALVKKSTNRQAAIYRINPMLFGVGKPKSARDFGDFWKLSNSIAKDNFIALSEPDYMITSNSMIDLDNQFLKPTSILKDTSTEKVDHTDEIKALTELLKTKKPKRPKSQGL